MFWACRAVHAAEGCRAAAEHRVQIRGANYLEATAFRLRRAEKLSLGATSLLVMP